jgi:hypothetical protein
MHSDGFFNEFKNMKRFGHIKNGEDLKIYYYEKNDELSTAFDAYVARMQSTIKSRRFQGDSDAGVSTSNKVFMMQLSDTTMKPKDDLWEGKSLILRVSIEPMPTDDKDEELKRSSIEFWYALQAGVLKIGPPILISGLLSDVHVGMIMERGKHSVYRYLKAYRPQSYEDKYGKSLQSLVQKASEHGWLLCDNKTQNMIITEEEVLFIDFDPLHTVVLENFDAACVEFINLFLLISFIFSKHYLKRGTDEKEMSLRLMGVNLDGKGIQKGGVKARFDALYDAINNSDQDICKNLLNLRLDDGTFLPYTADQPALRDANSQAIAKHIMYMAMYYQEAFQENPNETIIPALDNVKGKAGIVHGIIGNEFKIPTTPSFRNR